MIRAAAALAAAATIAIGVSGCETTQELSAKIGRRLGHQSAIAGTTTLGAVNREVRVGATALVASGGETAVAVELTNHGSQAQADFPVLLNVLDASGRSVYRNDTKGIEPALQQLAMLPAHATAWWVDNDLLASGGVPKTVTVAVGAAKASAPASVPAIATRDVSASDSFPGPHVSVTVENRSTVAQSELPVYAVALRDGHVVGAGRGVVAALAAGASAAVLVPIVGTVNGSTISLTIPPTGPR
jgi:hypothetical protein